MANIEADATAQSSESYSEGGGEDRKEEEKKVVVAVVEKKKVEDKVRVRESWKAPKSQLLSLPDQL